MKYIFVIVSFFIVSCAHRIESKMNIFLTPYNENAVVRKENSNPENVWLLDNNGNFYLTRWAFEDKVQFENSVKTCRDKFKNSIINFGNISIELIDQTQLIPSIYPNFVSCVKDGGFIPLAKHGLKPNEFQLSLSRTHSRSGQYMPIGGRLSITKEGATYIEVLKDVLACKDSYAKTGRSEYVEENFSGYIRVNAKPFFGYMALCLALNGYKGSESDKTPIPTTKS